jgi:hypothetical protein
MGNFRTTKQSGSPTVPVLLVGPIGIWQSASGLRESRVSNFDAVTTNMIRVRRFEQALVQSYYSETETILVVNDGAARKHDYRSGESVNSVLRWLSQIFLAHNAVNEAERAHEEPGLRSILAGGERATYTREFGTAGMGWAGQSRGLVVSTSASAVTRAPWRCADSMAPSSARR